MKLRERIFLNRYTLHLSNNKKANTFEHFSKFLQVYIPFIFLLTYGANRTLTTFLCNNYTTQDFIIFFTACNKVPKSATNQRYKFSLN